eukprot:g44557.t1
MWCKDNNLFLNISKTEELIISFRKQGGGHAPIYINGAEVEMVESVKFLGVTITNNLSWTTHVGVMAKKPLLPQEAKEIQHALATSLPRVHHQEWLLVNELVPKDIIARLGLRQVVREPTRKKNILDLTLTNLPAADASVHDSI